jgi:hypothetical protein
MLSGSLVTTTWNVLRLQIETADRGEALQLIVHAANYLQAVGN